MEQLIKQVWVSVLGPVFPKTSQPGGAGAAAELRDVLRGGEGSAKISGRKDVQDMVKSGYGENERIISDVIQPGCKCTKVTLYGSGLFPRAPFRLRLCLHFRGQLTERERERDRHTHTKIHCLPTGPDQLCVRLSQGDYTRGKDARWTQDFLARLPRTREAPPPKEGGDRAVFPVPDQRAPGQRREQTVFSKDSQI